MKYIKPRNQFLNEAFDSKAISRTLSFLDKNCKDKSTKSDFLKAIKKMKDNYDYPVDKIDDAFIKYTNKKEALKIKFDGDLNNGWEIYCLKFWFSLESGYIGYTATSNKNHKYLKNKKGSASTFNESNLDYIKSNIVSKGELETVTDYRKLKNGDKVIGCFSSYFENEYVGLATIIIDDDKIYAIQDVAEGSSPRRSTNWMEFGRYAWSLGSSSNIAEDHQKLHLYKSDNEPLRFKIDVAIDDEVNPLEWNLPVRGNGKITEWSESYSSIDNESDLDKADFSIVLFFDDMINPDKAEFYERPSDISREREESREGALKLMSDEEIKKINLERYLGQLVLKLGISIDKTDLKNLQKIIGTSLVSQYSLISILCRNYSSYVGHPIDGFISSLYDLIKHPDESNFKELIDQYKSIHNLSSKLRNKYDKSFNWLMDQDDELSSLLKEVLSKLIELGNKINDIISNKQINNIHDMRIFKSKLDSLRSILSHDDFAFTGKVKSIFSEFYDVSDVSYYYSDMTKSQLEKAKESLVYIERAIDSILK